ncbi:neutral zinc metallopeptidase [Mycolicibacterium sp.]|uniref:neutral zinc metallopeptidase n=1 Tax=Mycolicibacterium sp. TaxID=2320850 RepID=UPI0026011EE4|nr:neutral zinc metallopeptidase [Mycolicibacterium sp.]
MATGCSPTVMDGHPISMVYDPERVAGLPAADGPSGVRAGAPPAIGRAIGTNGGDNDRLVLLALNDIQEFWGSHYLPEWPGRFTPVISLISYDSNDPLSSEVCGHSAYGDVNAFFCPSDDSMAWDRGVLIPGARRFYGDISVPAVLAHEYGHSIQNQAQLIGEDSVTLIREQQADCFSGAYMRWVAEGHSHRFTMSTTDGLDHVLAGALYLRDAPGDVANPDDGHGSALDRLGAFQKGFERGPQDCAGIDGNEIRQRQRGLPAMEGDDADGETSIDNDSLSTLMELLGHVFHLDNPPALVVGGGDGCTDAKPSPPASYCPSTNTINLDLPALQQLAKVEDNRTTEHILQGDDTAFSMVTSRYALAVEHERGVSLNTQQAALRTACLTGLAQKEMARPIKLPSGKALVLSAGDLDEAVSGLLTNRLVASDVNGVSVPAGFTRIAAFRSGLIGDGDKCYEVFP